MRTKVWRKVSLAVGGAVAAAAMIVALVHPFDAQTHRAVAHNPTGSSLAMRPVPPVPPNTPIYGAIAVADNGAAGKSWGHRTRANAEIAALQMCNHPTCKVLSVFTRCGAIAHDGSEYHGGIGRTRDVAERDAKARLGGGWILTSVCH
ncbi:DUF4189 domain-containing protein [Mycobacterium spongiae]|uniref:DUF4189 domain-containing protein n=1 Tax=Mycobacterium spongiae TaxID=886343 RepID=A0A975PY89_9MYCO|nr:DUF4189 domain-containing protein [Mycobacterium spongiae]QUR68892.1 DUF4189 domain-containing protein [Mycobacterium spongiae]